jgi:hypothetical protein
MPIPKINAPNTTDTPTGATSPTTGWPNNCPPQRREKQQYRYRQHHHLRTQSRAAPVIDKHAPGRGETERRGRSQAQRGADDQQQQREPTFDAGTGRPAPAG